MNHDASLFLAEAQCEDEIVRRLFSFFLRVLAHRKSRKDEANKEVEKFLIYS